MKKSRWINLASLVLMSFSLSLNASAAVDAAANASTNKVQGFNDGRYEAYFNSIGIGFSKGADQFSLSPGFNMKLLSWLQAGMGITYHSTQFGDQGTTVFTLVVGPVVNLFGNFSEAVFLSLGPAIRKGTNGGGYNGEDDPGGFGFHLLVGKRIPISDRLIFRPNVGIIDAGTAHLVLNFLSISYVF